MLALVFVKLDVANHANNLEVNEEATFPFTPISGFDVVRFTCLITFLTIKNSHHEFAAIFKRD